MRISDWSSDVFSSDLGVLRARSVTRAICLVSNASLLSAVTATGVVCSASLVRRAVTTISSRQRALTGRAPSSARVGVAAPVETPVAGGPSEVPEAGAPLCATAGLANARASRSEEHTSEHQSLMRTSYAVFLMTQKKPFQHLHKKTNDHT